MNAWYESLSQDYQKNIDPFLQHIKMTCASELQGQVEMLYAILHLCVDQDDGKAIQLILKKDPIKLIQDYEDLLFENDETREIFLAKYDCGELNLWGKALSLQNKSAVVELSAFYSGPNCGLTRWIDEWEVVFRVDDLSNSYLEFCNNYLFPLDDDEVLFLLCLYGREDLAVKMIEQQGIVARRCTLREIERHQEVSDIWKYAVHASAELTTKQSEKIFKRLIDMINKISPATSWDCAGIIEEIKTEHDDMRIIVKTHNNCFTAEIDTSRNCCEIYGGYIICEDDVSAFIGSSLLKISLTDVALNNHIVKEINSLQNSHHSCDFHKIQFINFETTKGVLQFVVYNCHNGYYGHDITISRDDSIIYSDCI